MDDLLLRIRREANDAQSKYGPFASSHEAYGVLAEEVAELFDAIRNNQHASMCSEAIQVAAVSLRIADQTEWPRG